jgi:aquaporin Z
MKLTQSLREHWPEYLIEAWALGMFMVSAGVFGTLLASPASPVFPAIPGSIRRTALIGVAMGVTAVAIIHSSWGKRSGAHMNPAVTLTFLRLGKIRGWDAVFYILAQTVGGTLGVLIAAALLGSAFTSEPVSYGITRPGPTGPVIAFVAEMTISCGLMLTVLLLSASARLARFTGVAAGCLVALYISFESPLSGMSMNPSRTFASAAPAGMWQHFWIYATAPTLGMLTAAQVFLTVRGKRQLGCAKLLHAENIRCIHCGHEPSVARADATDLDSDTTPAPDQAPMRHAMTALPQFRSSRT